MDVPQSTRRFQCVSYAPYYRQGESPLVPGFRVSRERIEQDLEKLSKISDCVRLYAVDQGLDQVPELAGRYGMKVLLGAWISADMTRNETELTHAIALANRYKSVVRGLIVGNEVLLRREQTPQAMRAYLDRARQETDVPVTYADVWEFWLRNAELKDSVDFATIHILPYWEDDPQPIDRAIDHVRNIVDKTAAALGKPVLIGETGWPSQGKQREQARPGRVEQARFLREFMVAAQHQGWQYNVIEAFDQPWKRQLEGTVGGYWGMFDSLGQTKFDWQGPIAPRQSAWLRIGVAGLVGLLAGALLGALSHRRRFPVLAGLALLGALAGGLLPLQLEYLQAASRTPREWFALGLMVAATLLACASLPFSLQRDDASMWSIVHRLSRRTLMFGLACGALLLAADPRYRDFPFLLFALPTLCAGIAEPLSRIAAPARAPETLWLASIAAVSGIASALLDPSNIQAVCWSAMTLLCAFGLSRPLLPWR